MLQCTYGKKVLKMLAREKSRLLVVLEELSCIYLLPEKGTVTILGKIQLP